MSIDFTEERYYEILELAIERFKIIPFTDFVKCDGAMLLRHDIDFSVHRAARIAKIESYSGITSTYFINPHSRFYNILESGIANKINKIADLGHRFGLHFDPSFYIDIDKDTKINREPWIEKQIIEEMYGIKLDAISIHMPSLVPPFVSDMLYLGDMVNANSRYIKDHYTYYSDSFCTWKYNTIYDELQNPKARSIHVLLHPEYWTKDPMTCFEKIDRCIEGRASNCRSTCKDVYLKWVEKR